MMERKEMCICPYSECECQFQRHIGLLTLCESKEIWDKCKSDPDTLNYDL